MLRALVNYINTQAKSKDFKDFSLNILANIIGNKIDG